MTIKVLIVSDVPNWCYWKRAEALQKYKPADFEIDITCSYKNQLLQKNYDLVFFLPFSYVDKLRAYCNSIKKNPIILSSYNCGWGYSNNWLVPVVRNSDAVIINNKEMWEKSGKLPNTYYIPNGVDQTIFHPIISTNKRPPKILWCGSVFHKKVKGYDEILIPLQKKLLQKNIVLDLKLTESTSRHKLNSAQMAQWYNSGSIYICTSRTEGTPNPALEAASCGCAIVSSRVGNMPELIENGKNGYLIDRDIDSFYNYILLAISKKDSLCREMLQIINSWDWKLRSKEFFDLFRNLIEQRKKSFPSVDDKKNLIKR
jgi:glycosyltransferase involved in cell wall biosynthesis